MFEALFDAAWSFARERPRSKFTGVAITIAAFIAPLMIYRWATESQIPDWVFGLAGALSLIVLAGFIFIIWTPRKIGRGKVGVVVALWGETDDESRRLQNDLVSSLERRFSSEDVGNQYELMRIPDWEARAIVSAESARKLMARRRAAFLIWGSASRRKLRGEEVHKIRWNGAVAHAPVDTDSSRSIAADFSFVLKENLIIPESDDAILFEFASADVEIAARFVTGIAAFYSGNPQFSETQYDHVESLLSRNSVSVVDRNEFRSKLRLRRIQLYAAWSKFHYVRFLRTRDREHVERMCPLNLKALALDPNNYESLLIRAICLFMIDKNIPAAEDVLNKCNGASDGAWLYSLAFLAAYQCKLTTAERYYERAFRRTTSQQVPIQVEEFMLAVIAAEPTRIQLHYCLGLVNLRIKDDRVAAKEEFKKFLDASGSRRFKPQRERVAVLLRECEIVGDG